MKIAIGAIVGALSYWAVAAYVFWDLGWLYQLPSVSEAERVFHLILMLAFALVGAIPGAAS